MQEKYSHTLIVRMLWWDSNLKQVECVLCDLSSFVVGCSVRLCNSSELIADIIVTYTKALADRPFKY